MKPCLLPHNLAGCKLADIFRVFFCFFFTF